VRLALVLFKYFPYGGLQRDFLRLTQALVQRGHDIRVYCLSWQGEHPQGVDLRITAVRALNNHRRYRRFHTRVFEDLARDPVDGVIGFNKMPGLDVYFAGDPCFLEKADRERGPLYRLGARYRHFSAWERAVFSPDSGVEVLLLAQRQAETFRHYHGTPVSRLHVLPPGVAPDRRAPEDAAGRRRAKRASLALGEGELALLFVGSGFVTKGLDRAITALARLLEEQPSVAVRLLVVGQDKNRRFRRLAKKLGVAGKVEFLGGRDDVPDLMLAADLLVHPARAEAAGVVLLEAIAAGLPSVVTPECGYAPHVSAARAGIVLDTPFSQEQLDRAVMRNIDGVYRADCRESALLYARLTDLYSMHEQGAQLIETLVVRRSGAGDG
jgi:UDP-glucose:(heptosyl)LPS alpha-1,3-glucosyltransferase